MEGVGEKEIEGVSEELKDKASGDVVNVDDREEGAIDGREPLWVVEEIRREEEEEKSKKGEQAGSAVEKGETAAAGEDVGSQSCLEEFEKRLDFDVESLFPSLELPVEDREEGRQVAAAESQKIGDEQYLSEGEKLFVVSRRGVKNEGDVLKRRYFVKLMPGETEVEVLKCRLCRVKFRKQRSGQQEESGEKGGRGRQDSNSVSFTHISFLSTLKR